MFTNLRLTRTHQPIHLKANYPLLQVQPLPREAYAEQTLSDTAIVPDMDSMTGADWDAYYSTVAGPSEDTNRAFGSYAVGVRKRRQGGCPFSGAQAANEAVNAEPVPT